MHANAILSGMPASYISYHPVSTVGAVQGANLGASVYGAKLGASVYGVELGASVYDAELPAKSAPCQHRAQDLGASNDGAEQCKLGASDDGAELRVQILKSFLQGRICEKLSKKG